MPNVDRGAHIVTNFEPQPSMTVYEPTDVWIQSPADTPPLGAALVHVVTVGRATVCVYCRPTVDDREGHNGNADTTVRTYH